MTDREKLVELIVEIENEMIKAYPYTTDQFRIEKTVDHLLANGVTVQEQIGEMPKKQEWFGVEDRLPEKYVDVLGKSGKLIWVVSFDGMQWEDNYGYYHKIEEFPCWMPLPEPPKEEG